MADPPPGGASSFRMCVPTESSALSGPTKTITDSDADVAGDIATAPPGLDADPLDVRGFDPDMEGIGMGEVDTGALGPIWAAKLTDGNIVTVFGLTSRDGFDRHALREQVTERLRELAVIVHPNLAFPLGLIETVDGIGLVFRGGQGWIFPREALNACDFLHRASVACAVRGGSYYVNGGYSTWGLIGSVDALAVNPENPYVAPELVRDDDGRVKPTEATEMFSLAAFCAKRWYESTDPDDWKSRPNDDHIRPLLVACLSPDPNDRPDLDTALLWMMAEAEHEKAGWTAAHMACQRNRVDFLRSYLDGGGDAEAKTLGTRFTQPVSLLGVACKYGSLACLGLLLDRGADPIAGRALHWAASGGQVGLVDRFVASGVVVQVNDFVGGTNAAGFAALLDHFEGDPDEVATAYMSLWSWHAACLALLIRRGADIILPENAHPWDKEGVEKAHALAVPGAHPLDSNDPQPGSATALNASHRHRTHLSGDGRSIVVSLSGDGQGGDAASEVTINLPSWVHVYLSTDLVGSEEIGRGAFGEVTRRKLYGTTDVAVKAVNVPITKSGMQSFVWEVASHVMLSAHPHTVSLMGLVYDEAAGTLGLVCELMDTDLAAWLRESRSAFERACVLRNAADGLAYVHAKGLVHRDIKPANIFVRGSSAKIGDFGLTSVVGGREGWTRSYAAPEVLGRDDVSTAPSDAYSFGLVVYEVLAEVVAMPSAVERKGKEGAPPWVVKDGLPVPEGWWAMVLRRVLSSHPDERPPVSDWDEVLGAMKKTGVVSCSRFFGLCATYRWDEAMGCTEGVDTEGVNHFDDGRNALHFVAGSEDDAALAMVAKCVELGCDVNSFPAYVVWKGPPLALVETEQMAAELVAHGADVNAADEDMVTVLMWAARNGREVALRSLLGVGVDPTAADSHRRTAIDWVYMRRPPSEDVVMLLLEAGTVPGKRYKVLKEARRSGHDRVVAWLEGSDDE